MSQKLLLLDFVLRDVNILHIIYNKLLFSFFTNLWYNLKSKRKQKNTQILQRKSSSRFPFLRDNTNERTVLCHVNNKLKLKIKNKFQERID